MSWKAELTERIKKLAGENEAAFAKKAEISDQAFRKYLKGTVPGGENILKIARAGNCSTDWLLTGVEKQQSDFISGWDDDLIIECNNLKKIFDDKKHVKAIKENLHSFTEPIDDRKAKDEAETKLSEERKRSETEKNIMKLEINDLRGKVLDMDKRLDELAALK